jgi:NAD(P)-dependent dehydrogenase (short-subunit alcohol dehydrogenase family)
MAGLARLEGRVAVVTGGASGIGRSIAEELLARGARVVLADIEDQALATTASQLGVTGILTDVADIESMRALAAHTLSHFGRVDIVCNNAGVGPFAKIEELTLEDWKWVLDVNLWGVIHGVSVFLPHLVGNQDGGHIVNTASVAGLRAFPTVAPYCVSKSGVVAFSECLAMELQHDHPNVGVTVVCPGPVQTNIYDGQRNRAPAPDSALRDLTLEQTLQGFKGKVASIEASDVGRLVVESIVDGRLYAITHPALYPPVRARHEAIAAAHGAAMR